MSVVWVFSSKTSIKENPKIADQIISISPEILSLRNPWVTDSVFMGKLYTAMIVAMAILVYPEVLGPDYTFEGEYDLLAMDLISPFIFAPFLAYRILYIKGLSAFYLNRTTKKIYYQRLRKLVIFDWENVHGGLFKRVEYGGTSFSNCYALAFAPRREDGSLHQKDCLWIDSNEPTEADIKHVAQAWEYLRCFMDHGPDKLPLPGEPNWLYIPLHEICLTPLQAWRHYAPWRSGERGEMQGKKTWMLPVWAILFPYNLSVAICWYVVCRLFNVKGAPPPAEALEVPPDDLSERKRK
ncbi:MAG: hypothetical protein EOO15_13270 [Chitinophagaceae bacterium]|nr:MAG: hypothetical protein EOO15_13270 [Chitinophagaceae bacterium]